MAATSSLIERERTAIRRTFLSRPVSLALEDGLIGEGASILDYGCGRGDDVRHLRRLGYPTHGWDPVFAPDGPLTEADVVNLGYVVNVIEDPLERQATLRRAWSLARGVLVVSARLQWEASALEGTAHNDGVVTLKNTFQKFYTQEELRAWVESTLSVEAVAGAPGIFYVFRATDDRQHFLARRTRSRPSGPSVRVADLLFEQHRTDLEPLIGFVKKHRRLPKPGDDIRTDHLTAAFGSVRAAFALIRRVTGAGQWSDVDTGTARPLSERRFERHRELLQPLIDFASARGRMPRPGEIPREAELASKFGSVRAAYGFIRRLTGPDAWKAVECRCREDLLVYLALASFGGRPRFSDLPEDLQYDVRDFFGTYQRARTQADVLLFAAGNRAEIGRACQKAEVGKLTVEALYVHTSALNMLAPILRVYEGCARALAGTVRDTTLLKLHRQKAQVSYLHYPDFMKDPHPALATVVIARLSQLDVTFRDFRQSANPPVLHRKETFVPCEFPGRETFARLTAQEDRHHLLDNRVNIGTRQGWAQALAESGFTLRGHRLVRAPSLSGNLLDT